MPWLRVAVLTVACGGCSPDPSVYDTAITDVTVIPCFTDTVLIDQLLLIKDGRIAEITADRSLATSAGQIIPGKGKFLVPGLSDMHIHLPPGTYERPFLLYLAAGVLHVRSMRGHPGHPALRDSLLANGALAPRLFLSAPPVLASKDYPNVDSLVASWKASGFDQVKVLTAGPELLRRFGRSCRRHAMPLGGHQVVSLEQTVEAGYSSIEHLGMYAAGIEEGRLGELIKTTIQAGIYNCPTLDWYSIAHMQLSGAELAARPGIEWIDPAVIKAWDEQLNQELERLDNLPESERAQELRRNQEVIEQKLRIVRELNDAGAKLLLSPDATNIYGVPGYSLVEEMKLYRRAGLSNYEILRSTTYVAAEFRGDLAEVGSVETGKAADLVLLNRNPLEDIEAVLDVEGVFLGGRWLTREELLMRASSAGQ